MRDLIGYLLVRTDMPSLGPGKAYAHAMHAGNQMTWREVVEPIQKGKTPSEDVVEWHKMAKGFGTTIALGKDNQLPLVTVEAVIKAAKKLGFVADLVIDPTYPYYVDAELMPLIDKSVHTLEPVRVNGGFMCFRNEVTTAYVFGDKAELGVLLTRFGLAPNE
jgi:hypothetical protein